MITQNHLHLALTIFVLIFKDNIKHDYKATDILNLSLYFVARYTDTNTETKTITENTNRITSPPTYFLHADVLNILCNEKRR